MHSNIHSPCCFQWCERPSGEEETTEFQAVLIKIVSNNLNYFLDYNYQWSTYTSRKHKAGSLNLKINCLSVRNCSVLGIIKTQALVFDRVTVKFRQFLAVMSSDLSWCSVRFTNDNLITRWSFGIVHCDGASAIIILFADNSSALRESKLFPYCSL
jgi:hypothetical protein